MDLFGHPFSSYTWKALIAFYETGTPFAFRNIAGQDYPDNEAEFLRLWPVGKFPLLVDGGEPIMESSIIVEHVAPALVPTDRAAAREVRMLDRIFDQHVMSPMQAIVADALKPAARKDPAQVAEARSLLNKAYDWLDGRLAGREWAAGGAFTLADCAAGPALFYAHWVHPIAPQHAVLAAYRARATERPSLRRCIEEARPYRHFFPLPVPETD